jgi:hypothetical protein
LSVTEDLGQRQSARRPSHIEPCRARIIGYAVSSEAVPGTRMVTWDRTPLGLETATPCQPRAALAVEGSERRWILRKSKFPALHREAERDTTGSFSRQPPVHTWNGARAQGKCKGTARGLQGKRRSAATLLLIRQNGVKVPLTLWFYCGKRAARRHRFVGEPRKT